MKRRPKPKPRVTQLDRIELKLRKLHLSFDGVDHLDYVNMREHCAVLASHNRRLLEENETLKRWVVRMQAKATDTKTTPGKCAHEWKGENVPGTSTVGMFTWTCDRCGARKTTFTRTT